MPDRRKISEKYRRLQWIKDATDALSDKFDSVDEAERYADAIERISDNSHLLNSFDSVDEAERYADALERISHEPDLVDRFDSVDEAERYANALERIKLEESDREGRINSLLIEAACEYVISRALGKYNGE